MNDLTHSLSQIPGYTTESKSILLVVRRITLCHLTSAVSVKLHLRDGRTDSLSVRLSNGVRTYRTLPSNCLLFFWPVMAVHTLVCVNQ